MSGGPLSGIRVVDLGFYVAGPSAAGMLADWGADVIKIEPADGDPLRGVFSSAAGALPYNPPFELDNRGKRSICLNLADDQGRALAQRLVDETDVFVTNLRAQALERNGLDFASVHVRNPRLVYARISAYGNRGPDAERAAYDVGAFWARAGVVHSLTAEGSPPPNQRGGMGDHVAGLAAAAGIAAALLGRMQTGVGQEVSTSLLRVGAYMLGWDLNMHLRTGLPSPMTRRDTFPNPIMNSYRTRDGRWLWLLCLQADRHWPGLVKALDLPEIEHDPRFADIHARVASAAELVALLDARFAERDRAQWAETFDRIGVWWAPVNSVDELVDDPQAEGAGLFVEVPTGDGDARMVATPIDFSASDLTPVRPAPELGQHTEEILLELGCTWEDISTFAATGVIP